MKKIYSLLSLLVLTLSTNAQVEIREYTGTGGTQVGNDISGSTFTTSLTNNEIIVHFAVKNISGSDQYLRIKRLKINVPSDWLDGLCWGQYPDNFEGGCYEALNMTANPWSSPNVPATNHAPTISDQYIGDLKIDIHAPSVGSGHYRYYVMPNQGSTPIDSVDLVVSKTLSIEDNKVVTSVSVFPNPANNLLTVSLSGLENGGASVKIVDVLGKVVYSEEISGTAKKIDVSEFKNGVYLLTVLEKGSAVQTRRIVVRH